MNAWNELDRRCTGTNRLGERCARAPIPGGTVCILHGGASPNAQHAAKMRLLAMVEPVLGVFESIVEVWHSTRCPTCNKPTGDPMPVIRVGQLVLDRAGFHPTLTVQHASSPDVDALRNLTLAELADEAEDVARKLRADADAEAQKLLPAPQTFIDAYEIPDEEEPIPLEIGSDEKWTAETDDIAKETHDE